MHNHGHWTGSWLDLDSDDQGELYEYFYSFHEDAGMIEKGRWIFQSFGGLNGPQIQMPVTYDSDGLPDYDVMHSRLMDQIHMHQAQERFLQNLEQSPAVRAATDNRLDNDSSGVNVFLRDDSAYIGTRDLLYCEGNLIREDIGITEDSAQEHIASVVARFADYTVEKLKGNKGNFIGLSDGYRPPYEPGTQLVTWYDFPPRDSNNQSLAAALAEFNIPLDDIADKSFYGIKFNLDNGSRLVKVVGHVPESYPPVPENASDLWYARFYDSVGTPLNEHDIYFIATPLRLRRYAEEHGLTHPLPPNYPGKAPWLYSVAYSENDSGGFTLNKLKAYTSNLVA
jgi:hypothetical protein